MPHRHSICIDEYQCFTTRSLLQPQPILPGT